MDTKTIRAWVDKAGAAEVARLCGVGIDTVGRWAVGQAIPGTRQESVERAHTDWAQEQARNGKARK